MYSYLTQVQYNLKGENMVIFTVTLTFPKLFFKYKDNDSKQREL